MKWYVVDLLRAYWLAFCWYWANLFCAVDQLINAAFAGWCDETISSHAYRLWRDRKPFGWLMRVYDPLFAWQTQEPGVIGYCHGAYLKEQRRYQSPPEQRSATCPGAHHEQYL